jgi:hypothetical protein
MISDKVEDLINQLAQAYHDSQNHVHKDCTTCLYFDSEAELCRTHNARPPAKVIVTGCKQYEMDVPF